MSEILNAEPYVLDIASRGVDLGVSIENETYEEDNDASAKTDTTQLIEQTIKWKSDNFVTKLNYKPQILIPMTVALQYDNRGGIKKYHPCIDLSRFINLKTQKLKLKMDTHPNIVYSFKTNDFLTCFDMKNMYFHFKLNNRSSKLLNYKIVYPDNTVKYYNLNVMSYGYRNAS